MVDVAFAIPGDLNTPTGGYAYDREILARLPALGIRARHLQLAGGYPEPSADDLSQTQALFAGLDLTNVLLVDGLAFGAIPEEIIRDVRVPIIALVHHPLGYEPGLPEERAEQLIASERAALKFARRVIVTSPFTKRLLTQEFEVPPNLITVAMPGTAPAERASGSGDGQEIKLLSVGSITPRKGYPILVQALAPLSGLDWRLTIVGPQDRDRAAFAELQAAIARHKLDDRIELTGALDRQRIAEAYAGADVFVLPSLFEGFGMVLTEAMARGLPIVCTTGGAAAETVPDDAALKVPPGAVEPLREALRQVICDADLRRRLADASWRAAQQLPRGEETAHRNAAVVRGGGP
nr:MAG: glycosyl transferase family 1 [Pseudomonadota bacterium]